MLKKEKNSLGIKEAGLGGVLKKIFETISTPQQQLNQKLYNVWPRVLDSTWANRAIPRLKNKTVVVWVENSNLACEMSRRYEQTILKRLQNELGEEQIKKVWFCVGRPRD